MYLFVISDKADDTHNRFDETLILWWRECCKNKETPVKARYGDTGQTLRVCDPVWFLSHYYRLERSRQDASSIAWSYRILVSLSGSLCLLIKYLSDINGFNISDRLRQTWAHFLFHKLSYQTGPATSEVER